MLSLIAVSMIWIQLTFCHSHRKIHKCAINKQNIVKGVNLHEIHVPYHDHPYARQIETNNTRQQATRRSMLSESETAPIRISAYYDPTTISTNILTTEQISNLKATIGAIVNYYQQMVRVIPINGTFFMERWCSYGYGGEYGQDCTLYETTNYCQYATIPDDHLAAQYKFYYPTNESVTRLDPGRGVSATDLLLYVSADDSTGSCSGSGSTLAHAGPCAYDQYGRPIAGNINVCASFFTDHEWKKDTETMLHEMTHITIMLSSLWDEFRDSNGDIIDVADVLDESVTPPLLKTPILLQTVREHFDCPTASGLPVQTDSISHWSERHVFSENMNPTIYTQQMYYSKFTLALMEDSGWYLPNYAFAEPYFFGKMAGCGWFTDDCIDKSSHISNFPAWFCDSSDDDGCNQDNSAPAKCYYYTWNNPNPPLIYQYFADTTKGGSPASEYCPWRDANVVYSPDYESVCWDIRGNSNVYDTAYQAETWGANSRCTKIVATDGTTDGGYCFEHSCYDYDASSGQYAGVNIIFSTTETVQCTQAEKLVTKTLSSVSNKALTCPDIDIVCGSNTNFGACYWGHYSDAEGKCVCNPGYTGTDCNSIDDSTVVDAIPGPVYVEPTWNSVVCLKQFTKFAAYEGAWTFVGEYEYLPAYFKSNVARYLWWHYWDHKWYISAALGSSSNNCQCAVSVFTADISECSGKWKCGASIQSVSYSMFGACSVTPTASPTRSPTNNPSPSPTNNPIATDNPTQAPTNNPSHAPTNNPSASTTDNPTLFPSRNPSKYPTLFPSSNPSKYPSHTPTTTVPSNAPIAATEPTELFTMDIVIILQYEIEENHDQQCADDAAIGFASIIAPFTAEWIGDLDVLIDINITIWNDEANEMIVITYESSSTSDASLEELNSIITSSKFKQKLIEQLEDNDGNADGDCFKFLDVNNKDDGQGQGIGINVFDFDFANYGTTEILVVVLAGLICLICLWILIYLVMKKKQCRKEGKHKKTATVEFGEFGGLGIRQISINDKADALFAEALSVTNERKLSQMSVPRHVVNATPSASDLPLPDTNDVYYI